MNRLKNIFFLLFCLACVAQSNGQITGNLNVTDPKALIITDHQVKLLSNKNWLSLNITETRRGEMEKRIRYGDIFFDSTGLLNHRGHYTWEVINKKFIKISVKNPNRNISFFLQGAYSIYQISDSTLALAQILTSSGDWVKEFTFTTSKKLHDNHRKSFDYPLYKQPERKEGQTIKHYSNDSIASIENHRYVFRKVSAEKRFEMNMDPLGSDSILVLVPIGNWVTYFPNGKIESVIRYDNNGKLIQKTISYLDDGRINTIESDEYEYKSDKYLLHVKRWKKYPEKVFIIGHKDSVELSEVNFFLRKRVGAFTENLLLIRNLSNHDISIQVVANKNINVRPVVLNLHARDSIPYPINATILAGSSHEIITLKTLEWKYDLKINSFGYHLCAADFELMDKIVLPTKFYYYMLSEEYQLEIQKLNEVSKPKTIPFSQQLIQIELKKGKYRFTLVGSFGKKIREIEVR